MDETDAEMIIQKRLLPVMVYNSSYCITYYFFLNSFLVFLEDHIGIKCAIVCFNVSILGKYYIYIYAYFVICLCIEFKFVLFACIYIVM